MKVICCGVEVQRQEFPEHGTLKYYCPHCGLDLTVKAEKFTALEDRFAAAGQTELPLHLAIKGVRLLR